MIRRRAIGTSAALAVLGSAAFLASGHPLLNWPEHGLPIGTLVAGTLVSGLGALPLAIAPTVGLVRRFCIGVFALALAWLPLSLLLAGNWRLNFDGGARSEAATGLGLALVLAIVAAGLAATVARIFTARRA